MVDILAVGEVMLELSQVAGDNKDLRALGFAGDTYNTAVYLARLGVSTGYMTRLGDDQYSQRILDVMAAEAIDTSQVARVPGRVPGLYMIANTASGERTFSYWRGQSPAREMFSEESDINAFVERVSGCKYVYFSGITLGIISDEAKERMFKALAIYRSNGGTVAFDSNYRPQLWRDLAHVQWAMSESLKVSDVAMLTDEDEMRLWGDEHEAPILSRCAAAGVTEVLIKRGPKSVLVALGQPANGAYPEQFEVAITPIETVVDTTAAGDSFNAGYLATRVTGGDVTKAVQRGAKCAGIVIQHRGAIVAPGLVSPETV